ncbi:phage antirepressor KilAC domain-containing protein [Luteimonas sp. BDR2-5]|uniref:phage antirepressor KilAC domain-containing protein n=1 Tax=Proluteimonas luteida TaxID=2878685 RepID=UPI001E59EA81|nr:phage antirepressor KilAC domain-containing protein [Luteimonas sp. BDR2-5]MCD9029407.1 phage antirepressor KilAC domain-containing protein [Luteimonas sp. BDR2-5]
MSALVIANATIRRDDDGRFCLNDLHKAAGGEARHRPGYWLALDQTQALAIEIEKAGIPAIRKRQRIGTFVVRELVYAYAMWISAVFHLQVIRSFDALVSGTAATDAALALRDPGILRQLLAHQVDERLRLEREAAQRAPRAAAFDRLAEQRGAVCVTQAAKLLELSPRRLFAFLSERQWLFRSCDFGAWQAFQRRIDEGYLVHKMVPVTHGNGRERLHPQALVTPAGLARIALLLEADHVSNHNHGAHDDRPSR